MMQSLQDYVPGYIYLPALIMVGMASMLTALLGARAAHILPAVLLRKFFSGQLYLLETKLLLDLWN